MLVLVMNSGSSSLKFQLLDMATENVLSKGLVERIGFAGNGKIEVKAGDKKWTEECPFPDHKVAVAMVVDALTKGEVAVLGDLKEIGAIGHRVVQGGDTFPKAAVVDEWVKGKIEEYIAMAPLHNRAALNGILACEENMPGIPQVCVFDTSYHQSMDATHFMYAIPYEDYESLKVRRYGAHGTSHKFVAKEVAKLMEKPIEDLKIITCHLGNGASVSAIKGGKVIDTSMGFTPLEGLMMGTRTGDMDPAAVLFLMREKGMNLQEADDYFNKQSGLLGVSGLSNDFRDIEGAMDEGHERAQLAYDMFALRVKKYIGAYAAELNGFDAIAFTAGIGENDDRIRASVCADMDGLGLAIDEAKNKGCREMADITASGSKVRAFIVPTNEELAIAQETIEALGK